MVSHTLPLSRVPSGSLNLVSLSILGVKSQEVLIGMSELLMTYLESRLMHLIVNIHSVRLYYSKYSLIRHNSFSKKLIWRLNEFGELTGYSIVLVHYNDAGKLYWIEIKVWRIKR